MPSPRVDREWAASIAERALRLAQIAARLEQMARSHQPSIVALRAEGKIAKSAEAALHHVLYN